jgi:hypothetical protein
VSLLLISHLAAITADVRQQIENPSCSFVLPSPPASLFFGFKELDPFDPQQVWSAHRFCKNGDYAICGSRSLVLKFCSQPSKETNFT